MLCQVYSESPKVFVTPHSYQETLWNHIQSCSQKCQRFDLSEEVTVAKETGIAKAFRLQAAVVR